MSKKEGNERKEGLVIDIIRGIFPGLLDLLKGLERSEAFRQRLEMADREVERKLKEELLKTVKPRIDYAYSIRTIREGPTYPRTRRCFTSRRAVNSRERRVEKVELGELKEKEPLIDIFEEKDEIRIIAELPGVEESNIKINLEGEKLIISADIGQQHYQKEIILPCPVKREFEKRYKNGTLEIRLKKMV